MKPSRDAVIKDPINMEKIYKRGFPLIIGITNIPPWGAGNPILNIIESAPATAAPITEAGITLAGSEAAKGMAPSVIKVAPII